MHTKICVFLYICIYTYAKYVDISMHTHKYTYVY